MRFGFVLPGIVMVVIVSGLTPPLWASESSPPSMLTPLATPAASTVKPTEAEPTSFQPLTPLSSPAESSSPSSNSTPDTSSQTTEPADPANTSVETNEPEAPKVEAFQGRRVPSPGPTRAICDPIKQTIQTLNQWPLVVHPLILPPRAVLEWRHRRCLRPQSYREREFLESIPKP
jgi:hypothetical protein